MASVIAEIIKSITVCSCGDEKQIVFKLLQHCVSRCVLLHGGKFCMIFKSNFLSLSLSFYIDEALLRWGKRDCMFNCSVSLFPPSRIKMLSPIHYSARHIKWTARLEIHFQIIWISLQNLSHSINKPQPKSGYQNCSPNNMWLGKRKQALL